jgi:2-hydroxychromene-2-carboxylate isomerase
MPELELLFDYASPYAFLASEIVEARLPGAKLVQRPVYLRAFEAFRAGMPFGAAKLAYLSADVRRCALDAGVDLRFPTVLPINGLHALRGAVAAARLGKFAAYHQAMFRAAWQHGRDISRKEEVAAIATELGMPELADALDEPSIKDELRATTEDAIRRGAFGVPTFFVGREMFWGHDRMHQIAKALA